jgi:hypothetical protein
MNQLFSGLLKRTALCSPIEVEGDDPSHIDMRVGDRREPGDDIVREPVRILIPEALYALCVPSADIGERIVQVPADPTWRRSNSLLHPVLTSASRCSAPS